MTDARARLGPLGVWGHLTSLPASGADHVALIPLGADGVGEHQPVLETLTPAS